MGSKDEIKNVLHKLMKKRIKVRYYDDPNNGTEAIPAIEVIKVLKELE